jgi:hypothetical protein
MKRSVARAFVTGEMISGSADYMANLRPEVKELYNRTVRASRTYAGDYLLKGRQLKPPEIDVPRKEILWYFYSQNRTGHPFNDSTVLNSAWMSDSGNIGHVLVNWDDTTVDFNLELQPYSLPPNNYSVYITRNGKRSLMLAKIQLPRTVSLSLEPLDVVLLELVSVGNLSVSVIALEPGWNLISLLGPQSDNSLKTVLQSIAGSYDAVQWYDIMDGNDHWKHAHISRPPELDDLDYLDHMMGMWLHISDPSGAVLVVLSDEMKSNQTITLRLGWNMVGYPSHFNRTRDNALNNIDYGADVDSIWTFNAATQTWQEIGFSDHFELGRGYWIHSKVTKVWDVPL